MPEASGVAEIDADAEVDAEVDVEVDIMEFKPKRPESVEVQMRTTLFFCCLVMTTWVSAQTLFIEDPVRMLALGDSYTIGQGVDYQDNWPNQLMDSLIARGFSADAPEIVAVTGWTTSDLIARLDIVEPDSSFSMVSLLIGVNNQFRNESVETYKQEFEQLLQRAIVHAQGERSAVLVLSIPDYAFTPVGMSFSNVSEEIAEFNQVNDSISRQYGVPYISITDISQRGLDEPDLVASDRLHPSGKMYGEWVSRIISLAELQMTTSNEIVDEVNGTDIYPNPFSDRLFCNCPEGVMLVDVLGRNVATMRRDGFTDLSHLASGIYFVYGNGRVKSVLKR